MRVRDWRELLKEATADADRPADWRAIAGDRAGGLGEDCYLAHPAVGIVQLKTYAKNPFEGRGVGTRVARRIDEDLEPMLPDEDAGGRFGVRRPPSDRDEAEAMARRVGAVIETHADAPTGPGDLFEDLMGALDSPAHGPMTFEFRDRSERLEELAEQFAEADSVLDAELEDRIAADGVDRGFM